MIVNIFSVFDVVAKAYLQPFYSTNKGTAIRALVESMSDPKSVIARYPEQYVLFELGTFDDTDAKFDIYSSPRSVGVCVEFKPVVPVSSSLPGVDDQGCSVN